MSSRTSPFWGLTEAVFSIKLTSIGGPPYTLDVIRRRVLPIQGGLNRAGEKAFFYSFLPILAFLLLAFYQNTNARGPCQERPAGLNLNAVLKNVEQYCRRLENGVYDFICTEEISEKVDFSRDRSFAQKLNNKYLYDYQLVKKGSDIKERRILLEKNGRRFYEENAGLETLAFRHQHVLLRTVDLFAEFGNSLNDYRLIGEETLYGEEAIVIEAVPKSSYEHRFLYGADPSYLSGKIWVKKKDFSILKIIWNPIVIREIQNIEENAKRYQAEPRVTIISEYQFEKNGIRFPNLLSIEEAYINKAGQKFVRSKTDIVYKDYKFFIVETEIKYRTEKPS